MALKIISSIGLLGVLVISFFLGTAPLIEGKHLVKPYIDTHFAEDYSPEKFDLIELGMTKIEVIRIIGEPLYTGSGYSDSLVTNYHYTGDGKLLSKRKSGEQNYDDFAWYRSVVGFDTSETAVYLDKGWSYD